MTDPNRQAARTARRRLAGSRRLVLATAALAGIVLGAAIGGVTPNRPAEPRPHVDRPVFVALVSDAAAAEAGPAANDKATAESAAAAKGEPEGRKLDAEISIDHRGITIRKRDGESTRDHDPDVVIGDHEFESFEQFVQQAPWLAALVFLVVSLVFLVPLLVIVLVVWYKMRRARMMNETMLKLAERGVVPPGEAMGAIAGSNPGEVLQHSPATAPLYAQAKQLRNRAAWSDLRKGVILGGIGVALTFATLVNDGEANYLGLVLLFVGLGYLVLWRFERRELDTPRPPGETGKPMGGA